MLPRMESRNSAPRERIASLDGLRAISILLVIVGHVCGHSGAATLLSSIGVHIFFVLSGYLITRLLLQERAQQGRINLVAFYRRRCFRILPAAMTYILLVALLVPSTRSGLVYALTYTVSYKLDGVSRLFEHLWSLSVEEQFYLLWPLALLLGFRRRGRIALCALLLPVGFRLACAANPATNTIANLHFSFPGTMDSVAAGCLLAIYEPRIRERFGWMAHSGAIAIALPITAWTLDAALWNGKLSALWGIVPVLLATWVFLLIERRDWILNNPAASILGALSYSMYLWQQPFATAHTFPLPVALLLLLIAAGVSYFVVEQPMIALGKRPHSRHVQTSPLVTESATTMVQDLSTVP
jgi:peptidoglycan/LPS O-acetylase OafA/YrhL